jgi:hypothetical protein
VQASSGLFPDQGSELLIIVPLSRRFCGGIFFAPLRKNKFTMTKMPKKIEGRKAFFQMFVKNTVDGGAKNGYYGNTK